MLNDYSARKLNVQGRYDSEKADQDVYTASLQTLSFIIRQHRENTQLDSYIPKRTSEYGKWQV